MPKDLPIVTLAKIRDLEIDIATTEELLRMARINALMTNAPLALWYHIHLSWRHLQAEKLVVETLKQAIQPAVSN